MIYKKKPHNFNANFEVVSSIFDYKGEILLLKRNPFKEFPNLWGVPTGKIEKDESIISALIREIFEETGLEIFEKDLTFIKTFYVEYPNYNFIYHLFVYHCLEKPRIKINKKEHSDYFWNSNIDEIQKELIPDMMACFEYYFNKKKLNKINKH